MKVKNVSKKVVAILAIIAVVLSMPIVNLAHSGRTDSSGGHRDNKNASGLGPYHYHCGGHPAHLHDGGVCPYAAPAPAATATPSTPKATTTKSTTPSKVNATKVEIDVEDLELTVGEKKKLTATVSPSNATDKTVTWTSNNKEIIMIDSEGELVALGIGEGTVTAKTSNGKTATLKVIVNPIAVSEIKLNETEVNLKVEETVTLTAEVLPEEATDKTVEWSSENTEIATVEEGIITAIASGTTKVICSSKDGVKAEVNVVVEEEKEVETENTIEVSATTDESSGGDSTTTSDSDAVLGLATLGAIVGAPIYAYKKKKNKS